MSYYTRVLSKDEEFPPLDELAQWVRSEYPEFKLTIEDGEEEEWETLLLSGNDDVEVALLERIPVLDPDELGDPLHDTRNNILLFIYESMINESAFCLANPLRNDLFCRLGGNSSKISRRNFNLGNIIKLIMRIDGSSCFKRNLQARIKNFFHDSFASIYFN